MLQTFVGNDCIVCITWSYLDSGEEVGQDDGEDAFVVVERPQVREGGERQAVQQRAAAHHAQVGHGEKLQF